MTNTIPMTVRQPRPLDAVDFVDIDLFSPNEIISKMMLAVNRKLVEHSVTAVKMLD